MFSSIQLKKHKDELLQMEIKRLKDDRDLTRKSFKYS